MSAEWLEVGKAVAVALIVLAGQRIMARASQKANEKTAIVQEKANEIDGADRLTRNLTARLEKVEQRADLLAERVQALEEERRRDKSLIRHLIDYVHTLRDALRRAQVQVPDAPAGLDLDGGPLV